jgi:hypothetical protein
MRFAFLIYAAMQIALLRKRKIVIIQNSGVRGFTKSAMLDTLSGQTV